MTPAGPGRDSFCGHNSRRLELRATDSGAASTFLVAGHCCAQRGLGHGTPPAPAHAVISDLEDGVIPSAKPDCARGIAVVAVSPEAAGSVRINNATSGDWSTDLCALDGLPGLSGVMLTKAKCESAQQVDATTAQLSHKLRSLH